MCVLQDNENKQTNEIKIQKYFISPRMPFDKFEKKKKTQKINRFKNLFLIIIFLNFYLNDEAKTEPKRITTPKCIFVFFSYQLILLLATAFM